MSIDSLIDAWKRTDATMRARAAKRIYGVQYRADNKDKLTSYYYANRIKKLDRQSARYRTAEGRAKNIYRNAQKRASVKGLEFSIPFSYVVNALDVGICEVTGVPFSFDAPSENCRVHPWGPSLDRIDNQRGYVIDNVQIVCNIFNLAKSDFPEPVIYALAQALVTYKSREN